MHRPVNTLLSSGCSINNGLHTALHSWTVFLLKQALHQPDVHLELLVFLFMSMATCETRSRWPKGAASIFEQEVSVPHDLCQPHG